MVTGTRFARLEPALARADAWWQRLSPRERVLVATLGALLALVVLVYGIAQPLIAARAAARADIRQAETLAARVRAAGRLETTPAARTDGPPATIVTNAATAQGFAANVVERDGAVVATVADAPYAAVVAWTAAVARTSAIGIRAVRLQRGGAAGRVAAVVEFVP